MTYRVVGWSTGNVGRRAIGAIARRRNMELVGLWVHSPDKVGVDAGTLAGMEPIGVAATNDIDALLALKPDCVCYTAQGEEYGDRAIREIARILEAGINVVTSSSYSMIHPASMRAEWRELLEAAALKGGATAYSTGIEPGYADDQLTVVLAMMSETIESVRIQEFYQYDGYNARGALEGMGFALPADQPSQYDQPGHLTSVWGGSVRLLADRLGMKLDRIRENYERLPTPRTLEVACGTIEAGTTGALRFQTIGVVDGRDAIIIEHINRMAADLAPEWPNAAKNGTYRVTFEGNPGFTCDVAFATPTGGMVAHTMLLVNAIPYVCDAPPGLVTTEDLPIAMPVF
jgi:hypothetical protein